MEIIFNMNDDTALYGRQSLDKKDSVSIEAQLEKGRAVCNANNWGIYNEYSDKGYSGKDIDRPSFQKLLKDIENGYVKRVIVYRLDRISRSITDFANLLNFFEKYNTTFISATENFDTSSPLGRAMIYIIMVFAQLERETIAERITDNYYFRAKKGLFMGGGIPYGFSSKKVIGSDGKKKSILEINEEEITIVKTVYDLYANQGYSIRGIVAKLNQDKIKPRNQKLWSANQISRMLTRPIYTSNSLDIYNYFLNKGIIIVDDISEYNGKHVCTIVGKEKGKGKYKKYIDIEEQILVIVSDIEPIVASETWLKVQAKMRNNKAFAPRIGQSNICFLSGLLYCGHCGYSMSFKTEKKKSKTYNYICCNTKKNRGYNTCVSKLFSVSEVEDAVLAHLVNHITENDIYNGIQKIKEKHEIDVSLINRKNFLEANVSKCNVEIQNLLKAVASGESVVNTYVQKSIEEIDTKLQEYKTELDKIHTQIYSTYSQYDRLRDIKEYLKNPEQIVNCDFDTKKSICKALIKKITLHNDKIDIEYFI